PIIAKIKEFITGFNKAEETIPAIINNEQVIAVSQSNNAFEQKTVVKNDAISVLNPLPVIEQKIAVTKNEVSNIEPLPNIKIEASIPIIAKIENPIAKK
ncbi:hypothetical protein, partial [Fluviispira multicolorata]|uniref:hypothetical protein n=1 Tax=Fluviispira multicolorata TaxID=2654512 RepID=UPI001375FC42